MTIQPIIIPDAFGDTMELTYEPGNDPRVGLALIAENVMSFTIEQTRTIYAWLGKVLEEQRQNSKETQPKPTVVCLCGSTRFCEDRYRDNGGMTPWQRANYQETLAGRIVLTIGVDFKSDAALGLTDADKHRLDALHLAKIDLADEVLVLNIGNYIGASTAREIAYAKEQGKRIRYLICQEEMQA